MGVSHPEEVRMESMISRPFTSTFPLGAWDWRPPPCRDDPVPPALQKGKVLLRSTFCREAHLLKAIGFPVYQVKQVRQTLS